MVRRGEDVVTIDTVFGLARRRVVHVTKRGVVVLLGGGILHPSQEGITWAAANSAAAVAALKVAQVLAS